VKAILRWALCLIFAGFALEVFFIARIAAMAAIDPQSTAFQRSEAWQLATQGRSNGERDWKQRWVPYSQISDTLKRAVIASEDDQFIYHQGVEWEALEKACASATPRPRPSAAKRAMLRARAGRARRSCIGGSTITQQLAKNLLLSGERTLLRKGQEMVLAFGPGERAVDKQRILEIYLNSVEWGEGVFGAEAAAQHYFRKPRRAG
jgi:monofunctional biosynthetic peptidoglycan transglycosylase